MKKDIRLYPALLSKDDKYISVRFPDLPGCNTFGEGYAEAIASAKEALGGHLLCMEEDGDVIPAPTPIHDLKPEKGEAPVMIDVRMDILRKEDANKSINKNVTIPRWLNDLAVESKINFSSTLQEALREKLGV